jgi:hypothetical protein
MTVAQWIGVGVLAVVTAILMTEATAWLIEKRRRRQNRSAARKASGR